MNFKLGDKVKIIKNSGSNSSYNAEVGKVSTVVNVMGGSWPYELMDISGWWRDDELKLITNNNNIMKTLKETFNSLFLNEPEKSYRKAGITDNDGLLTEDGEKIYLTYLLRNDKNFKKDVVDLILEEQKED